uniref:Uncharacterized protein n=1 Tax=Meloidogyne hapla TaxID=6305 RepID=A0A1I8AYD5_MELHA
MKNIPSNFYWVLAENCFCPVADNLCYRPEMYSKPLMCAHSTIKDFPKWLENPIMVNNSTVDHNNSSNYGHQSHTFIYVLLFAIIALQLFSWFIYGLERFLFVLRGKQLKRQREERVFAPDRRAYCRKARRPITTKDIGPPQPLICRVTQEKVEVHELGEKEVDEMEFKENVLKENIKEEKKELKETKF